MVKVNRINVSQVEGGYSDDSDKRPNGEMALYNDDNGGFDLVIHDGVNSTNLNKVLGKGKLYGHGADSADGNGYDTIKLIPDIPAYNGGSDQYIIIDPTGPNHIHIRAGGTIDNSNSELILGGENSNVKIGAGPNPQITVESNSNSWTFDTDGTFIVPGVVQNYNSFEIKAGNATNTVEFLGQIDNGFGDAPGATLHITSIIYGTITNGMTIYGEGLPVEGVTLEFGTVMAPQGDGGTGNYYLPGANYLIGSQLFNNGDAPNSTWIFGTDGHLNIPGNIIFDDGSIQTTAYTGIQTQPEYPVRAYIIGGMISLYNSSTNTYDRGLPIIYSEDVPNFDYVPLKLYGNIEYGNTSILVDCQSNINQALSDFPGTYVYYSSLEVVLVDADNKIVGWATSATSPIPMPTHGSDGYKLMINLFDFPDLSGVPDTWVLTNPSNSVDQYEGRIFTDPVSYKQISSRFIDNLEHNWNNIPNDPIKDIIAGTGISISSVNGAYTINSTGSGVLPDQSSSIVTTVFNETGSVLPKMTAVYIDGGHGDRPTVSLALATGDPTSAGTYAVTLENIDNMELGQVIVFGALTGVNTDPAHGGIAGATEGSTLYLSPTTPGGLTTTKPSAPNHMVVIGTVVRVHQNQGIIEVRIQNGYELDELHNVAISGVMDGQFLQYNGSSELWVPGTIGLNSTMNGRLSLSSSEAVTTNDITNANTLYYHPYDGNTVSLYNTTSSSWKFYSLSSVLSYSLSGLLSSRNYDIFLFHNGTSLALEIEPWSSHDAGTSTRATNLVRQNGVLVKSGSLSRRYLGTLRASGPIVCEDSLLKRFLYNHYNKIRKKLSVVDPTDFTFVGDGVWQPYNGNVNNQIQFIDGLGYEPILASLSSNHSVSSGTGKVFAGLSLNTTNTIAENMTNSDSALGSEDRNSTTNTLNISLGYNYMQILQRTTVGATGSYTHANASASIYC